MDKNKENLENIQDTFLDLEAKSSLENSFVVCNTSFNTIKAKPFKETKVIDTNNLIGEFNPEMNEGVHLIKAKSQELVNLIEKHCPDDTLGIKRLAILKILEAQMLSVKLFF